MTPLPSATVSVIDLREDLHLQVDAHAGRTNQARPRDREAGLVDY
jgi:hypothetical protein